MNAKVGMAPWTHFAPDQDAESGSDDNARGKCELAHTSPRNPAAGSLAGASSDCRLESGGRWRSLEGESKGGGLLVNGNDDMAALARLLRYSQEEALRLGVSGVVVECIRMANVELTNAILKGGIEDAEAVRMN